MRQYYNQEGNKFMGKIIAVANQKGGVGKTTTSINLSACLGNQNKKTILVDLDPQGNATSGLGIDKNAVNFSIYDVLINKKNISDTVLHTDCKNLDIIPSEVNLAGAEVEIVEIKNREFLLKENLNEIKDKYDYIIIDCPPSLGLLTVNAFCACDTVLVPIQCEYYALEGLSMLTKTIKSIKSELNKEIDLEGVLMTMYDSRTNLSTQVVNEVKKFFPDKVFKTVIPRNVRLSEAPSFGQPIIKYDKLSKGAFSYIKLAKEIIKR